MLRGFQRIPVRKDVEPDPPRLFRSFKSPSKIPKITRISTLGKAVSGNF